MTLNIHLPNRKLNFGDRLLKLLGKERRPIVPKGVINSAYKEGGPFVYLNVTARYESFWSALWGGRNKQ
ncbi:MAG: hypothetical protein A2283_24260 [Lentisphaerae bacterium RIFOXYA12_FULL_48_11]|nr:MAG: hypothetical protein A2283_24260 [Lentisphaerae bacterium RIFOXYA12_FULL_48_11]